MKRKKEGELNLQVMDERETQRESSSLEIPPKKKKEERMEQMTPMEELLSQPPLSVSKTLIETPPFQEDKNICECGIALPPENAHSFSEKLFFC